MTALYSETTTLTKTKSRMLRDAARLMNRNVGSRTRPGLRAVDVSVVPLYDRLVLEESHPPRCRKYGCFILWICMMIESHQIAFLRGYFSWLVMF